MYSGYILMILVAVVATAHLAIAGFEPDSKFNKALYWGQNSGGGQKRLSEYCADAQFNIVPVSFLTNIGNAKLNFANMEDGCSAIAPGSELISCPEIAADIDECQQKHGKTILLSLGGATTSEPGFDDDASAELAAINVWESFGPWKAGNKAPRPFGKVAVDGFDFDFETALPGLPPFANELRRLIDKETSSSGRRFLITAAPQCQWPDAANWPMMKAGVSFDALFVQFYNNWCGLQNFEPGSGAQKAFNFERWDRWAREESGNPNVKIFLGVPASETAASTGYVDGSDLDQIIAYSQRFESFGGVMMWDVTSAYANAGFLDRVTEALGASPSSNATEPKVKVNKGEKAKIVEVKHEQVTKEEVEHSSTAVPSSTARAELPAPSAIKVMEEQTTTEAEVKHTVIEQPTSTVQQSSSSFVSVPVALSTPSMTLLSTTSLTPSPVAPKPKPTLPKAKATLPKPKPKPSSSKSKPASVEPDHGANQTHRHSVTTATAKKASAASSNVLGTWSWFGVWLSLLVSGILGFAL